MFSFGILFFLVFTCIGARCAFGTIAFFALSTAAKTIVFCIFLCFGSCFSGSFCSFVLFCRSRCSNGIISQNTIIQNSICNKISRSSSNSALTGYDCTKTRKQRFNINPISGRRNRIEILLCRNRYDWSIRFRNRYIYKLRPFRSG